MGFHFGLGVLVQYLHIRAHLDIKTIKINALYLCLSILKKINFPGFPILWIGDFSLDTAVLTPHVV